MKIENRKEKLRDVRSKNKVPGVLFGKTIVPVSIQVDEKELLQTIRNYGYTQTFKVKLGKDTHTVYIKEAQKDILNHSHFLNFKLQKVSKGDTITANVPFNLVGREKIEKPGVLLQIIADNVEVEYGVGQGVTHIDVDVSKMMVGDTLHVKDLNLPEGLKVQDDADKLLISLSEIAMEEPEEVEEVEEIDPSEVEAIKQKDE